MSKAFTRESDVEEAEVRRAPNRPLPGSQRYITSAGARRIAAELQKLEECAALASPARLAELRDILEGSEVAPVPRQPWDRVKFGARVTVRERDGAQAQYRIVSPDEMDFDDSWISARSPLARALLNARIGQKVRYETPAGAQEAEVLGIDYPE